MFGLRFTLPFSRLTRLCGCAPLDRLGVGCLPGHCHVGLCHSVGFCYCPLQRQILFMKQTMILGFFCVFSAIFFNIGALLRFCCALADMIFLLCQCCFRSYETILWQCGGRRYQSPCVALAQCCVCRKWEKARFHAASYILIVANTQCWIDDWQVGKDTRSFKGSMVVRSKVLCTYVLRVYARTS